MLPEETHVQERIRRVGLPAFGPKIPDYGQPHLSVLTHTAVKPTDEDFSMRVSDQVTHDHILDPDRKWSPSFRAAAGELSERGCASMYLTSDLSHETSRAQLNGNASEVQVAKWRVQECRQTPGR